MAPEDLEKKEALAEQYAGENRIQEAVGLLYELIVAHAGEKTLKRPRPFAKDYMTWTRWPLQRLSGPRMLSRRKKPNHEMKATFLEKDVLEKWKSDAPVLEDRLSVFCGQRDRIKDALENAGVDRGKYTRVPVSGWLVFQKENKAPGLQNQEQSTLLPHPCRSACRPWRVSL